MSNYPSLFRVAQKFDRQVVESVEAEVRGQLTRLGLQQRIRAGQTVAITAGSRGIANIGRMIRTVVEVLQQWGAEPFIVPAMGSHGGATAAGQRGVLQSYGITESACGCPVRCTMETDIVCRTRQGIPVHFDRYARQADHVLVCNRIKPHTKFHGKIESGLVKMMLIGLGKHQGAATYHAAFQDHSFDATVTEAAEEVIRACRVVAGLGIVENAYDQTALIEAIAPERIVSREAELLQIARRWLPHLPFRDVDILILDEIGKDISGAGMDTNIVGRKEDCPADQQPRVKRIVARDLTDASHGNATGVGIADFCLRRLADKMDNYSTWINGVTASHLAAVKLPPVLDTDRQILDWALQTVGLVSPEDVRLLWIRNTLDVREVECSSAYLAEAEGRDDLTRLTQSRPMPLDARGMLPRSMVELAEASTL